MNLKVYQVAAAPAGTARWLLRILAPIEAARFEQAPPLELRSTGTWSGWSESRDMAPDGRVALSNRVHFYSAHSILNVYLHEAAHSLLHDVPGAMPGHDCAFFALSVSLRFRVDSHQQLEDDPISLVSEMSIYDLADLPPAEFSQDVGRCVTWSIKVATQLSASDLSAEGLAHEIVKRYQTWLDELRDQPRLDRIAVRQAQGQAAAVDRLQDKLFVSNVVACVSSVLLVLIAVMLWCR